MGSDSQSRLSVYMYADEVDEREETCVGVCVCVCVCVCKWAHAHAAAVEENWNLNASSTSLHRRTFHIY